MLATTHLIFGGIAAAVLGKTGLVDLNPITLAAGAFGALLPDIDHPSSTIGRRVWPVSLLISGVFGHRGITHSLFAVAAILGGAAFYQSSMPDWIIAMATGYLSHLAADWLTPSGIPLLWPNRCKFASPHPIRTGGIGEFMLTAGLVGGVYLWVWG